MKNLMWLLQFALKAAIFFTLFAFALNNQDDVVVHFFFGNTWHAPLVLVLLSVFAMGMVVGVMGMLPRWWQHRQRARALNAAQQIVAPPPSTPSVTERHGN